MNALLPFLGTKGTVIAVAIMIALVATGAYAGGGDGGGGWFVSGLKKLINFFESLFILSRLLFVLKNQLLIDIVQNLCKFSIKKQSLFVLASF